MAATVAASAKPAVSESTPKHARLTGVGVWMGTPAYMAPELAHGALEAFSSSDLWAFGVMACEILTGKPPFETPPLFDALSDTPPPAPRVTLANGPLRDLILGCLDIDRTRRPDAREALRLLNCAT